MKGRFYFFMNILWFQIQILTMNIKTSPFPPPLSFCWIVESKYSRHMQMKQLVSSNILNPPKRSGDLILKQMLKKVLLHLPLERQSNNDRVLTSADFTIQSKLGSCSAQQRFRIIFSNCQSEGKENRKTRQSPICSGNIIFQVLLFGRFNVFIKNS